MKKVQIISEKVVFDDRFRVLENRLQFEKFDGQMSEPVRRLTFERGDAARRSSGTGTGKSCCWWSSFAMRPIRKARAGSSKRWPAW